MNSSPAALAPVGNRTIGTGDVARANDLPGAPRQPIAGALPGVHKTSTRYRITPPQACTVRWLPRSHRRFAQIASSNPPATVFGAMAR